MSVPMQESQIRPPDLFNRFLDLTREDIETFFSDRTGFQSVPCPACLSTKTTEGFVKLGFEYALCAECGSLYVSSRPPADLYRKYHEESVANRFFSTHFIPKTSSARTERIYRPRAMFLCELVNKGKPFLRDLFVDVGSGTGLFLNEVLATGCFVHMAGIEPAMESAGQTAVRDFKIVQKPLEEVEPSELSPTVMGAYEVLEHVLDPEAFVTSLYRLLRPNGLCVLTTLTISGFDLQVLWSRSKSIHPPHHINFLSIEGMRTLAVRCGFEVMDLSTPGELDLDIVRNALGDDPELAMPRFIANLALSTDDSVRRAFQTFLQRSCLSSHVRCVLRKPAVRAAGNR